MRQETMVYVGLDVHKEFCQACVIDSSGRVLRKKEVDVDKFEQENIAQQYDSIADGIQKELIQNAWDARLDKVDGGGWRFATRLPHR